MSVVFRRDSRSARERPRPVVRRQSGQSLIELVLTMFAFFTIAFMYVQVGMGFAVANYFQYVTFMGARAYLSGGVEEAQQKKAALSLLEVTLRNGGKDRFASIAKAAGDGGDLPGVFVGKTARVELGGESARRSSWEQGVTYSFKMRMHMLPLVKAAKRGEAASIELKSESWLGRDPSEEECLANLRKRKKADGPDPLFDNGC